MPKLLIVDDESEICQTFTSALTDAGFSVRSCQSGTAAIELFRRERADLVFLDMVLPGLDGLKVLGALKGIDPWVTVVVVTGYGTVDTATHALRLGAYDFLEKPCTLTQIQQIAKRAMDHRKVLKELTQIQGKPGQATDLPTLLTEVEQLKTDFLTMAVEELREPLRLLNETLDLAHEGFFGDWSRTQHQFLNQCERIQALMSRLLLGGFALFLSHEQRLVLSAENINALVESISQEKNSRCRERGITLKTTVPCEPASGTMDREKVVMILKELLDNAIQATLPGGTIQVELKTEPSGFLVSVSDTGFGMPVEEQQELFNAIQRISLSNRTTRKVGLGLALVRHYLDLLNGKISVESQPSKGSRFSVNIPWQTAPKD